MLHTLLAAAAPLLLACLPTLTAHAAQLANEQARLTASDGAAGDWFGYSVALSGDTAIVGAFQDHHAGGLSAGSAYVFVRNGAGWIQQAQLIASDAAGTDTFGWSVALSGDTAIVGALFDSNAGGLYMGSAYVFVRSGTGWSEQAKLVPTEPPAGAWNRFGWSVALEGDTAVVGADGDDHAGGSDAGAAYVFRRSGTHWSEQAKPVASDASGVVQFGAAVALFGNTALVGAPLAAPSGETNAGAAHIFRLQPAPVWVDLGAALGGAHGEPVLAGSGTLLSGDTVTLALGNALEFANTFFVVGLVDVNLPFAGGTMVPAFGAPHGQFVVLPTNGAGELELSDTWPAGIPAGTSVFFQHWIVDPGGPFGFAASNAVKATLP